MSNRIDYCRFNLANLSHRGVNVLGDALGQRVSRVRYKKQRNHMILGITFMSALQVGRYCTFIVLVFE